MTKIYIKTFGCPLNKFDTNVIEYYILNNGYVLSNYIDHSDVIIVNSCGVKKQTEDKVISYLRKIRNKYGKNKKLILAGCLPRINYKRVVNEVDVDAILGPSPGAKILKVIESVLGGEYYEDLSESFSNVVPPLNIHSNEITKPVAISSGCIDNCSFCGTRLARGYIKSYPPDTILGLIKRYVKMGAKEIYLTSLDNGVYGFDLNPRINIINLLKLIDKIDGDFIVRIGMMNPRWAYKYLEDFIELFNNSQKFYHFLHIPVQSGSDKVLRIMNRGHGVEEYIEVIKRLRNEVDKKFTIMTDIIVGHPGEEDDDFVSTIELIKESQPDYVNISQFFPRPGTLAAEMKKVPTKIVKRRSTTLSGVVDSVMFKRNLLWSGWRGAVMINEYGKLSRLVGRNYAYKLFAIEPNGYRLGDVVYLRYVKAYTTWIYGEPQNKASSLSELWKHL